MGEAGLAAADGAWFHGRPVMVNRNDYRTGLMNGDVGLCLQWPQDNGETALRVVFQKADGQLHHYATTRIVDCQTAWAMTVHKSQGSEFAHVVLMLPERDNPTLTIELVYTGITRAGDQVTVVSSSEGILRLATCRRTDRASALTTTLEHACRGSRGFDR